MNPYIAEFIGTALLVLLGDGVVANVVLNKTKGQQSGWVVITFGWAMAVFVGVLVAAPASGAHLNPAVSVALALAGKFAWAMVPLYIAAQMLGAFVGAAVVLEFYRGHFAATGDPSSKLAVFCTGPAIRAPFNNFFCEAVGTFVLVLAVLFAVDPTFETTAPAGMKGTIGLGALGALPVALIVLAIGLSLGGTTGYAINPARDLGPRLAHALLPVPGKGSSDWGYTWIPVCGPLAGGALAALAYGAVKLG